MSEPYEYRDRAQILSLIAKLKVDYISPASGIDEGFLKKYKQRDIRKSEISIPNEAFIDKNILGYSRRIWFLDLAGSPKYKEYLTHFADEMNIPMFITNKFGHGRANFPLVYGAKASIENNSLSVDISKKI